MLSKNRTQCHPVSEEPRLVCGLLGLRRCCWQGTARRGAGHSASGSRTQRVGVQHAARRGAAEPSGVWTRHPFLGPSTVSRQASAPACPFVPKWRPSCWFSVWSHKRLEKPLPSSVNLWEELRSSVETQLNTLNYLLIHLRGISQVKATHTHTHTHNHSK